MTKMKMNREDLYESELNDIVLEEACEPLDVEETEDKFENFAQKNSLQSFGINEDENYDPILRAKIEGSMYEYMRKNYKKVLYWICHLANASTSLKKLETLAQNSHTKEDIINETYARILKTFYDNDKRLIVCQNCKHQCKEFLHKTKKTNTEKYTAGRRCRPYMYYDYTEKDLQNYINRSVKQNIDIKLRKLTEKGVRKVLRLEETVGGSEDACELGSLLSDMLSSEVDLDKDKLEELFNKKIVFVNKLADFELDDPIGFMEIPDDNGNLVLEDLHLSKEQYVAELDERFDLLYSDTHWEDLRHKAEDADIIKIGQPLTPKIKALLENREESGDLDSVLPDDYIMNLQAEQGNSQEQINDAYETAMLDMIGALPSKSEVESWTNDLDQLSNYLDYQNYLYMEEESEIEPKYDDHTEIYIKDSNYKVIPLPLCTYAEISVREFLDLCFFSKQKSDILRSTYLKLSDSTFKEFWISFNQKSYNISESECWLEDPQVKVARYRLLRYLASERRANKIKKKYPTKWYKTFEYFKDAILKDSKSITELPFEPKFIDRILNILRGQIAEIGYSDCMEVHKIKMQVLKKVKLTEQDRRARAKEEYRRVLDLKEKSMSNQINASTENTFLPNLSNQGLYQHILRTIPKQEKKYVLDEVKVVCVNHSDNHKNVVSI